MTNEQLQAIKDRCERNQGRNDGMIRQDVRDLLSALAAARRCGSCRHWDPHDRRCYNGKSPALRELCVLRYQSCGAWEDLREMFKQRDSE